MGRREEGGKSKGGEREIRRGKEKRARKKQEWGRGEEKEKSIFNLI